MQRFGQHCIFGIFGLIQPNALTRVHQFGFISAADRKLISGILLPVGANDEIPAQAIAAAFLQDRDMLCQHLGQAEVTRDLLAANR